LLAKSVRICGASRVQSLPIPVPDVVNVDSMQHRAAVVTNPILDGGKARLAGSRWRSLDKIATAVGPGIMNLLSIVIIRKSGSGVILCSGRQHAHGDQ
jgi:hypothetical protein